jgi:hypothetical protein
MPDGVAPGRLKGSAGRDAGDDGRPVGVADSEAEGEFRTGRRAGPPAALEPADQVDGERRPMPAGGVRLRGEE